MAQRLPTIGFCEYVDLPRWRISGLPAKVDTGARSSALHVENLGELAHNRVRFDVMLDRRKTHRRVPVVATVLRRSRVRSSSGELQLRYFVRTKLHLGPHRMDIEISLVDRRDMIFRMLLGRSVLEHRFLVDVGRRYLLGAEPALR